MTKYTATYLDCGHTIVRPDVPNRTGGTGYGVCPNGERWCYGCCHRAELDAIRDPGTVRYLGYLSLEFDDSILSNWPGGELARIVSQREIPGRWQGDRWIAATVTYRAEDCYGGRWYGSGQWGQSTTMRRLRAPQRSSQGGI